MWKFIKVLIAGVAVSFYFFPFEFTFLPGVNTKMAMAGVGLVLYVIDIARGRVPQINKGGFIIAIAAIVVSICGVTSVIVNNTSDYTYATYIVSMLVWLGGAYTAVKVVRWIHGFVSVELICNYLICVCVAQCALALMIDMMPGLKELVNQYVLSLGFASLEHIEGKGRLYGIGAAVDVAGTRFSAVLLMIVVVLQKVSANSAKIYRYLYFIAFLVISVIGNMIARTTTIGVVLALAYLAMPSYNTPLGTKQRNNLWLVMSTVLILIVPLLVYLYNTNVIIHHNIRFAFEGFFSLVEKGYWETNSNNILRNMIIFPDNLKTWVLGDGYFENPIHTDPYYVGPRTGGFYMGTDIGYLRFIFYFGLLGLCAFILFFWKVTEVCSRRYLKYTILFKLLFLLNCIIWLKVSTDIFLVFALFICVDGDDSVLYQENISMINSK